MSDLKRQDILAEQWREYDIPGRDKPYRIEKPVALITREGGTGHRVVDADGVVHYVPAPTATNGVVLRWYTGVPGNEVQF